MKLKLFQLYDIAPEVRPAPLERDWMEVTPNRFAYRCLPLNIANQYGWQILSPATFAAIWDGRDTTDAISVISEASAHLLPVSHFGSGILTFHVRSLFRTEPGWDMFVTGPMNHPKDAISPLSGVIETDWTEATFTMNWKFTRPGHLVAFEEGEPICQFFPIRRGQLEEVEPVILPIKEEPELHAAYKAWAGSRFGFNKDLRVPGSEARAAGWQRNYFQGDGGPKAGPARHRTKLRLRPFAPPK